MKHINVLHRLRLRLRRSSAAPVPASTPITVVTRVTEPAMWGWATADGRAEMAFVGGRTAARHLESGAIAHAVSALGPVAVHIPSGRALPDSTDRLSGIADQVTVLAAAPAQLADARQSLQRRVNNRARRARDRQRRNLRSSGALIVATDGSVNPAARMGGWSWYVNEDCWAAGTAGTHASTTMELEAVAQALESNPGRAVHIITDCRDVAVTLTSMLGSGRAPRRWGQASSGGRQVWARIAAAAQGRPVTVEWLRAHQAPTSDIRLLNRAADLRARKAMQAAVAGATPIAGPGDYTTPAPVQRKPRRVAVAA